MSEYPIQYRKYHKDLCLENKMFIKSLDLLSSDIFSSTQYTIVCLVKENPQII